jgi:hypothetical protein
MSATAEPHRAVADFVANTCENWLAGPRTPMKSPGPVRSSFFT